MHIAPCIFLHREILCRFRKRSLFLCADFSRNHHYRLASMMLQARAEARQCPRMQNAYPGSPERRFFLRDLHGARRACLLPVDKVEGHDADRGYSINGIAESRRRISSSAITPSRFRYSGLNYRLFGLIRRRERRDERLTSRVSC